ncbi:hypothetical protein Taro_031457 [Colocasia esculenta]|uniref:Uncharacterized protein n=1 Tax=Colocasia esculenta TaxID=4460 RepID=A0A843VZ28_COLES|nr:hypothetical protein [Colocasia esculenta]
MTYERRFYFNLPEVQNALHANRTNLPYSWSMCSSGIRTCLVPSSLTEKQISIFLELWYISMECIPQGHQASKCSGT